jgi:hypothetical protein
MIGLGKSAALFIVPRLPYHALAPRMVGSYLRFLFAYSPMRSIRTPSPPKTE